MVAGGVNEVAVSSITPARVEGLSFGAIIAIIAREENGIARLKKQAPRVCLVAAGFIVSTFYITLVI